MKRKKVSKRMRGLLAAGLWTFTLTVCPIYGEAALPPHPVLSSPATGKAESNSRLLADRSEKTESSKPVHGENATDRIRSKAKGNHTPVKSVPENRPTQDEMPQETVRNTEISLGRNAEPVIPQAVGSGYTEAEIREQIQRKYTQPRPEFRLLSGAFAGSGYRPGTMDVKIPTLFFPPDVMQDVSETFLVNPDGTFGTRSRED